MSFLIQILKFIFNKKYIQTKIISFLILFTIVFFFTAPLIAQNQEKARRGENKIVFVYDPTVDLDNIKIEKKTSEIQAEVKNPGQIKTQNPAEEYFQKAKNYAKENPFVGAKWDGKNHLDIALERINNGSYGGTKCAPEVLAAIHYTENGLRMNNGDNGQGAFQMYSSGIRYDANSEVTDWSDQVKRACDHFINKAGGADVSKLEGNINLIGKTLAKYNGGWAPGIQAYAILDFGTPKTTIKMWSSRAGGYVDTPAIGWEHSPYTANFALSKEKMMQCARDGCQPPHNYREIYGTISFLAQIKQKT